MKGSKGIKGAKEFKAPLDKNSLLNAQGFTLIEIMVAITTMSLMMVSVYSIIDNSTKTKDKIIMEDADYLQVQKALNRFSDDFSEITSPIFYETEFEKINQGTVTLDGGSNFDFTPTMLFPKMSKTGKLIPLVDAPDKSSLIFMTSSYRRKLENEKSSRYAWVKYELVSDKEESEEKTDQQIKRENLGQNDKAEEGTYKLTRTLVHTNIWRDQIDFESEISFTLLKNIKSMDIEFWNQKREKWVDQIRSTDANPLMINVLRMTLVWIDLMGHKQTFIRIFKSLMPKFDAEAEKEKLKQELKKKNREANNNNGPG